MKGVSVLITCLMLIAFISNVVSSSNQSSSPTVEVYSTVSAPVVPAASAKPSPKPTISAPATGTGLEPDPLDEVPYDEMEAY